MEEKVKELFQILFEHYGPQNWWPAHSRLEVVVGAILTQNTAWRNVERAIENLRGAGFLPSNDKEDALSYARKFLRAGEDVIRELIRPAGFFNQKSRYLLNFMRFFVEEGGFESLDRLGRETLREKLLSIRGIGRETADSIILYAFGKPIFVVDAYTRRVFLRHGLPSEGYERVRLLVESAFGDVVEHERVRIFKEFHALLVRVGKDYCRKRNPRCRECPLSITRDTYT